MRPLGWWVLSVQRPLLAEPDSLGESFWEVVRELVVDRLFRASKSLSELWLSLRVRWENRGIIRKVT